MSTSPDRSTAASPCHSADDEIAIPPPSSPPHAGPHGAGTEWASRSPPPPASSLSHSSSSATPSSQPSTQTSLQPSLLQSNGSEDAPEYRREGSMVDNNDSPASHGDEEAEHQQTSEEESGDLSDAPSRMASQLGGAVDAPLSIPEWQPDAPTSSSPLSSAPSLTSASTPPAQPTEAVATDHDAFESVVNVPGNEEGHTVVPVRSGSSGSEENRGEEEAVVVGDQEESEEDQAARASSLTSEAIEKSVWSSEERASAALQQFSTTLHSKLVEQLIDDAATAVEQTLHDTIQQHEIRLRTLLAHNRQLSQQLMGQAVDMEALRRDVESSVMRDLQRVLQVDLRHAFRAASSVAQQEDAEGFAGANQPPASPPPDGEDTPEKGSDSGGSSGGDASVDTRHSSRDEAAATSEDTSGSHFDAPPATVEELVAGFLGTRGSLELLRKERALWRHNTATLQTRLLAATQENVQLRQELDHLRTTTVSIDEHRVMVHAYEEAEHQCELMRLQMAKQCEEAEVLVALLAQSELKVAKMSPEGREGEGSHEVPLVRSQSGAGAHAAAEEEGRMHRFHQGPEWNLALRELEEQAAIAANTRDMAAQLAEAEERQRALQIEREESVALVAALKEEGDVLRTDLQSLVYRNGVLSQQVASLLVKVEQVSRACRQLQATRTDPSTRPTITPTSPAPSSSKVMSTPEENQQARLSVTSARAVPYPSQRRDAWLTAMWPSAFHDNAATKENTVVTAAAHAATNQHHHLLHTHSPTSSFCYSTSEVEEGVQQRLSTYASSSRVTAAATPHRSRNVSLRQFGSAALAVSRPCEPRLPASDQLSGYALGRPSSFSTLNAAQRTFTRVVGSAEVSVKLMSPPMGRSPAPAALHEADGEGGEGKGEGAVTGGEGGRQTTSVSSQNIRSADNLTNDLEVLRLLDTLDKDENFDRFSVNSVAELVARNQELVRQLYAATQRAEAAEAQGRQTSRKAESHVEKGSSVSAVAVPPNVVVEARITAPPSLTTDSGRLLQERELSSRKRPREEVGADSEEGALNGATETRGASPQMGADAAAPSVTAPAVPDTQVLLQDAREAVARMVDALVRQREIRLTTMDAETSRALLKALTAQRTTADAVQAARVDNNGSSGIDNIVASSAEVATMTTASSSSRAVSTCVHSLLQLCIRQSASMAEMALTAAEHHRGLQTAVKDAWTEVQKTLLAALQTATPSFATESAAAAHSKGGAHSARSLFRSETAPPTAAQNEFRSEDQIILLEQLGQLLQNAARKDETLMQVYQAAQARQEARQRTQRERLARLLQKLARKRRIIEALRQRQTNATGAAAAAVVAGGLSAEVGTQGTGHAMVLDTENSQGTVSLGFHLSPPPGSPAHRTPPMAPVMLPASHVSGSSPQLQGVQERRPTRTGDDHESSRGSASRRRTDRDVDMDNDSDDGSDNETDYEDEALVEDIFRELRQQLAMSQANHQAAQEELDEEKRKHTSLLERMWVLEASLEDAAAIEKDLRKRMQEMRSRDAYDTVAADLAATTANLHKRDTELKDAQAACEALQQDMSALKHRVATQLHEASEQRRELQDSVHRQERSLVVEEDRSRMLYEQLKDVKQLAAGLENSLALVRREVQDWQAVVHRKDTEIEELKMQMLMRDDVQQVLCRLYPDDSVLQANAQLVCRLSETTTALQLELAEVKQDLAHAREEMRLRDISLSEAVQSRQSAEVRLQDAVVRLASLQGGVTVEEEGDVVHGSDAPAQGEGFHVNEASLAALRTRVHYLSTCMEAQAKDIAVLRAAESSWKQREKELRAQLEVMSEDPVSRTARRYGLSTCLNFEAQFAEMQARQDTLQASLATLQTDKARLEAAVQTLEKNTAVVQKNLAAAEEESQRVTAQLTSAMERSDVQASDIADLKAARVVDAQDLCDLQQRHEQLKTELLDAQRQCEAVQQSLGTATKQRDQFFEDNTQLIAKVEELEKALLQSDAEKLAAREALAQGLSSSSGARRHRRGGSGDPHRGQATSLTQGLGLSFFPPHAT